MFMDDDGPDLSDPHALSRRALLKRAAAVGAALSAPACALTGSAPEPLSARFEALTRFESDVLEAIVARLIPTNEDGPGATEARAARYIDRALGGALAGSHAAYTSGLAALDAYARSSRGAAFVQLSAPAQDAVLTDVERNLAPGFAPDSTTFFEMVRTHTIEGTFCDPAYGGNADFVGWELVSYPGLRLAVGSEQQQLSEVPGPRYRSAYDFVQFSPPRVTRGR